MALPAYATDAYANGNGLSEVTLSAFSVSGANRYLLVGVGAYNGGTAPNVTNVTRVGNTLTQLGEVRDGPADFSFLWGGVAPATGAADVVVTMQAACSEFGVGVVALTNVRQDDPVGAYGGAYNPGGGNPESPHVTVEAGAEDLVVDCGYLYDPDDATFIAGGGQTEQMQETIVAGGHLCISTQPGTAGGEMTWANSAMINLWVLSAVPLHGAQAGDLYVQVADPTLGASLF